MRVYVAYSTEKLYKDVKQIIESSDLGIICGDCAGEDVDIREVTETCPDLVVTELKLSGADGIEFTRKLKEMNPDIRIIMAGTGANKKTIADAYTAGVTFYVAQPLHPSEILSVLRLVSSQIELNQKLSRIRMMMDEARTGVTDNEQEKAFECRCRYILSEIGISHEKGSSDIVQICWYLYKNHISLTKVNLENVFREISASPRTSEQRTRRAISAGLTNMALLGMHDSNNMTYARYCNNFYPIADVRQEIEYLEGKRPLGGKISIKKFLNAMLSEFQISEADKKCVQAV